VWAIIGIYMIAEITLIGIVLIGLGLAIQGWFILDLNKRVSYANGLIIVGLNELKGGDDEIESSSRSVDLDV
jgi:hypothetical protein